MTGLPFGPSHPYRQTPEMARNAAQANKGKSPWRKGPMVNTANALRLTQQFNAAKDRAENSPSFGVGRSLTG